MEIRNINEHIETLRENSRLGSSNRFSIYVIRYLFQLSDKSSQSGLTIWQFQFSPLTKDDI